MDNEWSLLQLHTTIWLPSEIDNVTIQGLTVHHENKGNYLTTIKPIRKHQKLHFTQQVLNSTIFHSELDSTCTWATSLTLYTYEYKYCTLHILLLCAVF